MDPELWLGKTLTDFTVRKNIVMPCHLPDTCLQFHTCSEPLSPVPSPNLMAVVTVALCDLTSCCGHSSKPCVSKFSLYHYSLLQIFLLWYFRFLGKWGLYSLWLGLLPRNSITCLESNSHTYDFILSVLALMPEVCVPTPLPCSSIPFELSLVSAHWAGTKQLLVTIATNAGCSTLIS